MQITDEFLAELEKIDYPLPPDQVRLLVKRLRMAEREAVWLADALAMHDCPHGCPTDDPPTLEECRDCWLEAARKDVSEKEHPNA